VPEKRARPDFFLIFYLKKTFFFSFFFHILMQSEKYIFENTFWSVYLNHERDRLVLLQGLDLPFPPSLGQLFHAV
jgi:hypothetical protein